MKELEKHIPPKRIISKKERKNDDVFDLVKQDEASVNGF
jgi:hypothetical protein